MAKVVGPLNSIEARGSVGSLTYNTFRGISTVKGRCPKEPRDSFAQLAVRELTRQATAYWQAMERIDVDLWNAYAQIHTEADWTGQTKRISGYNWFIRINVRRLLAGAVISADLPTAVWTFVPLVLEVSSVGLDMLFEWTDPYDYHPEFAVVEVRSALSQSAGRTFNLPETNTVFRTDFYALSTTVIDANTGYFTFYFRIIDGSGIVSPWQRSTFYQAVLP